MLHCNSQLNTNKHVVMNHRVESHFTSRTVYTSTLNIKDEKTATYNNYTAIFSGTLQKTPKCVSGRRSAPDPTGGSRCFPNPLVGWKGDTPPHCVGHRTSVSSISHRFRCFEFFNQCFMSHLWMGKSLGFLGGGAIAPPCPNVESPALNKVS